jgi:GntR family transcriptional regulator/MocR family aminotransferase
MRIPLTIRRTAAVPIHRQIYDEWRTAILGGRLTPGDRVPSTRELAAWLGVARQTVTTAYDQLIAEGYLEASHGSGTFVCRQLPDELMDAAREARRAHGRPAPARLSDYGRRLPAPEQADSRSVVADFTKFGPDLDRFPLALWRRVVGHQLRHPSPALTQARDAAGYAPLRREIAGFVARSRASACTPDQVLVVNGSQQAIDLCARLLVNPGDEVAVENPGYPAARQLFAAHGARVRAVPVAADGLSVAGLSRDTRLVYTTPSHQFPTGVSMSLPRRLELVEWARRRGAVILEDDYDSVYRYSSAPLPALHSFAQGVAVIYMGTFSNVMFPALRLGYLVLPSELVGVFTEAKRLSDRGAAPLEQAALTEFMREGHLERHIRRMTRVYRRRRETLAAALAHGFGTRAGIVGDAAGMHLFVRAAGVGLAARAARAGVRLVPAGPYYAGSKGGADEYLMPFAALGERAIRDGIERLTASR